LARDRQRAKQRRRRQSGGTGPTGPARTRPPREAPVEEPTDTVFPKRGDVGPVEEDVEFDETVDLVEAEEEAVEAAPDQLDPAVTEERDEQLHPRRRRGRIFTFLGHVVDELRRVIWPDRRHVAQGTAVVLGFVVIAGTFLGLMDAIWKPLVEAIL
jgi:preprotein translocase SecE subunit